MPPGTWWTDRRRSRTLFNAIETYHGRNEPGGGGNLSFWDGDRGTSRRSLELNAEAMRKGQEEAKRLGLEIGTANYEATVKYKQSINELGLAWTSLENEIAPGLMDALHSLATWLTSDGMSSVKDFAETFKALLAGFEIIGAAAIDLMREFKAAWDTIEITFSTAKERIVHDAEGIKDVFLSIVPGIHYTEKASEEYAKKAHADFEAGAKAGQQGAEKVKAAWMDAFSAMSKGLDDLKQRMNTLNYGPSHAGKNETALPGGPKTLSPGAAQSSLRTSSGGSGKGGAAEDLVATWQQAEERLKDSQADLTAWSTAQDYQFWNQKLAQTKQGSDQWWQIWHKMADDWRTMAQEQQQALEKQRRATEEVAAATAAMVRSDAQTAIKLQQEKTTQLYNLGQISASQQYQMMKAEYDKEYTLQLTALYQQLALFIEHGDQTESAADARLDGDRAGPEPAPP